MITIQQEIRHHDRNFSIIAERWPDAADAAKAVRWARDWIEDQQPTPTRLLHFVMTARQTWAGPDLRIVELDEAEDALQQARKAGFPAYCEESLSDRVVRITADREEIEDERGV
jgi:hypothetical protein